jgi:hypothetical protein
MPDCVASAKREGIWTSSHSYNTRIDSALPRKRSTNQGEPHVHVDRPFGGTKNAHRTTFLFPRSAANADPNSIRFQFPKHCFECQRERPFGVRHTGTPAQFRPTRFLDPERHPKEHQCIRSHCLVGKFPRVGWHSVARSCRRRPRTYSQVVGVAISPTSRKPRENFSVAKGGAIVTTVPVARDAARHNSHASEHSHHDRRSYNRKSQFMRNRDQRRRTRIRGRGSRISASTAAYRFSALFLDRGPVRNMFGGYIGSCL